MQPFPDLPVEWNNPELDDRWTRLRAVRRIITTEIEGARRDGTIGSSLQAQVELTLSQEEAALFAGVNWSELAIVSHVDVLVDPESASLYVEGAEGGTLHGAPVVRVADGEKCVRCWKVLPETGTRQEYPGVCLRCADVVEQAGLGKAGSMQGGV